MGSCCICIDVIVAMADPIKRPGGVVSSGGRLIVMHSVSSSCRDLAISANQGGAICFCVTGLPSGVFTLWVKILGAPVLWLESQGQGTHC